MHDTQLALRLLRALLKPGTVEAEIDAPVNHEGLRATLRELRQRYDEGGAADMGASLLVVFNALRLLRSEAE